jgi:hypothetical protein
MDKNFIEKIVELAEPNIITENGYVYTDKILSVIKTPQVSTMNFKTLRWFVDTLKKEYPMFHSPIIVNVIDAAKVEVYSAISSADRTRETPYHTEAELVHIDFNRNLDYETMMITLKSKFVETPELLEVIKLLGTITEQNSAQATDDGFTQTVVVRKGIALKDNKVVKPIVKLKPYRTFNEVDQPESEFLLRLSEGGYVALYEADGGAWKLQARTNVAEYLRAELAELIESGVVIVVE